jgi:hypothetical protein
VKALKTRLRRRRELESIPSRSKTPEMAWKYYKCDHTFNRLAELELNLRFGSCFGSVVQSLNQDF